VIEVIDLTDSKIILGDSRKIIKKLPSDFFQCCITSPPYWGLRDYGIIGQIGAELTIDEYIKDIVLLFREVKRTLKTDGTVWLNIGDSYTSGNRTWRDSDRINPAREMTYRAPTPIGLKAKDLIGIPWRLAFALQSDGWYLRSDIIWNKPNCQPESVKDRPTRSHEFIFLLSKSEKYYYDYNSVKEKSVVGDLKNRRSVWNINTNGYKGAHFAVFPPELVKLCMLAGTMEESFVLDPFFGSGTVGEVANLHNRKFVGIELNPQYIELAHARTSGSL
jgi:site-specific DNA-methyltransferase (cytosine-N4-specific)